MKKKSYSTFKEIFSIEKIKKVTKYLTLCFNLFSTYHTNQTFYLNYAYIYVIQFCRASNIGTEN